VAGISYEEGVDRTIEWFRRHMEGSLARALHLQA
jgi:hypothetical protein